MATAKSRLVAEILYQDKDADAELGEEGKPAFGPQLPYSGNVQKAALANDRESIRIIMASRRRSQTDVSKLPPITAAGAESAAEGSREDEQEQEDKSQDKQEEEEEENDEVEPPVISDP